MNSKGSKISNIKNEKGCKTTNIREIQRNKKILQLCQQIGQPRKTDKFLET